MSQHHHHFKEENLIIVMILNFTITLVEVIGGLLSGSLSLLSDALHSFSDGISIVISFIALRLGKRSNSLKNTFGYKRAEILGAMLNASFLLFVSFILFKEAFARIYHPQIIQGNLMISVAFIGFMANLISVFLLKPGAKESINIRAAYIHLFSDTLSSVGVILAGISIYFFQMHVLDSVMTFLIASYVLKGGFDILKQSVHILMEKTPANIDILELKKILEEIPEVANLHHVHVWQTNEKQFLFEGHIDVKKDISLSQSDILRGKIDSILLHQFGINHTTIQMEYNCCMDKKVIKK